MRSNDTSDYSAAFFVIAAADTTVVPEYYKDTRSPSGNGDSEDVLGKAPLTSHPRPFRRVADVRNRCSSECASGRGRDRQWEGASAKPALALGEADLLDGVGGERVRRGDERGLWAVAIFVSHVGDTAGASLREGKAGMREKVGLSEAGAAVAAAAGVSEHLMVR
ncbi:hypothetical protein E2C01_068221 [Portunus trituberculatus]|uniref:Uncharacterized protein n=1 Tax=Portunus trituberculatus TaxID=210409 RepID=A0A5B7HNB7_PORTR|nr:hypothetical protein [Portunus trituberculatus]